jgi:hypothetical protein
MPVFSSTKSVIRAEWDLPETEGGRGEGRGRGHGGEMTQTMYAHVMFGFFVVVVFLLATLGFELSALHLQGRHFTT